jgi:hypothetical protein
MSRVPCAPFSVLVAPSCHVVVSTETEASAREDQFSETPSTTHLSAVALAVVELLNSSTSQLLSESPSALDQVNDYDDDGNHEEEMN